MRTKAEGGTIFTVCDVCWKKAYPNAAETSEDDAVTIARLRTEVETLRAERDAERARAEQATLRVEAMTRLVDAADEAAASAVRAVHDADARAERAERERDEARHTATMYQASSDENEEAFRWWKATAEARPAISHEDAKAVDNVSPRHFDEAGKNAAHRVFRALRDHARKVAR
jgi:hypothetical protein